MFKIFGSFEKQVGTPYPFGQNSWKIPANFTTRGKFHGYAGDIQ
jgi:hypothetical protein